MRGSNPAENKLYDRLFELYKFCRSELDFEYCRINDRMSWLLIGHAFLFTVLATLLVDDGKRVKDYYLYVLVSFIGLVSAGLVVIGIGGAKVRIALIKCNAAFVYADLKRAAGHDIPVVDNVPGANFKAHILGGMPSAVLPNLLAGVWGFIFCRGIISKIQFGNGVALLGVGIAFVFIFFIICLCCQAFGSQEDVFNRPVTNEIDSKKKLSQIVRCVYCGLGCPSCSHGKYCSKVVFILLLIVLTVSSCAVMPDILIGLALAASMSFSFVSIRLSVKMIWCSAFVENRRDILWSGKNRSSQ